jgi:hypothetical protein
MISSGAGRGVASRAGAGFGIFAIASKIDCMSRWMALLSVCGSLSYLNSNSEFLDLLDQIVVFGLEGWLLFVH